MTTVIELLAQVAANAENEIIEAMKEQFEDSFVDGYLAGDHLMIVLMVHGRAKQLNFGNINNFQYVLPNRKGVYVLIDHGVTQYYCTDKDLLEEVNQRIHEGLATIK